MIIKKETKQAIAIIAIIAILILPKGLGHRTEQLERTTVANLPSSSTVEVYQVSNKTVMTAYTLSVDETDGSPRIGAGSHNLCELKPILKEKGISICASRDLPLHTFIYIQGVGVCEILDRLNVRYTGSGRIDILMDTKAEALSFGIKKLNYIKL